MNEIGRLLFFLKKVQYSVAVVRVVVEYPTAIS